MHSISGANIAAGDHIKITLTDNGGNKVDLLLNVDSQQLRVVWGMSTVVDGDIHYADNGYTALNTVLGQAGHAGITVKLGYNGTARSNKISSRHSRRQAFTLRAEAFRSFAVKFQRLMHLTCQAQRMHKSQ